MSNDVAYLENILSHQANQPFLYGCHNFYPQEGTGLPYAFFLNLVVNDLRSMEFEQRPLFRHRWERSGHGISMMGCRHWKCTDI